MNCAGGISVDIDWYGHSCFRLREGGVTIVTDPFDKSIGLPPPRLRADVVTISHDAPGHANAGAVKGAKVISRPGEYEIKEVFITGLQTWRGAGAHGEAKEENTVFVFECAELVVCHLGDLARGLSQAQVESLPSVDVLLVPVGAGSALDADKASEMISLLEPSVVIPMHYQLPGLTVELDPLTKFLKVMGVTDPATQDSLRVAKSSLPDEMQVVVLECKQS